MIAKLTATLGLFAALVASVRGAEVCCPDTRCFSDDPPFDTDAIPLPDCIIPEFFLYRGDMTGSVEITLGATGTPPEFEEGENTIFLVHGWQSDKNSDWVQQAKDALVIEEPTANVVVVDWSSGASDLYYPQSASNTRTTGAYIALMKDQLDASWCIGHSLGAHTCGYAGKDSTFNRITGLDPAGPFFEDTCNLNPIICRLHKSDADQVDVIHTDGKDRVDKYGTLIPLGDIDFYPNAADIQPGCSDFMEIASNPQTAAALGCSHGRACLYFIESIKDDCFVVREKCTDHNDLPGSCSTATGCPNMGYSTASGSGLYHLETSGEPPYCLG